MGTKPRPIFRSWANRLTDARPKLVADICEEAYEAGPNFRSFHLAGKLAVALGTDGLDGKLGRLSNIPDPEYSKKDRDYDKLAIYMLYGALGEITGDSRYHFYLITNLIRDARVDATRDELMKHGFSTGARSLGKDKMRFQTAAHIADFSPLGDIAPDFVHGLHTTATGLAIVSGIDIEIDARRKQAATNNALMVEDTKNARVYTTQEP